MPTLTMTEAVPGTERNILVILEQDEEWIAAEFAAIMAASGMTTGIAISAPDRRPAPRTRPTLAQRTGAPACGRTTRRPGDGRVRSPPCGYR